MGINSIVDKLMNKDKITELEEKLLLMKAFMKVNLKIINTMDLEEKLQIST